MTKKEIRIGDLVILKKGKNKDKVVRIVTIKYSFLGKQYHVKIDGIPGEIICTEADFY